MAIDLDKYKGGGFEQTLSVDDVKEGMKFKITDIREVTTQFGDKLLIANDKGEAVFLNSTTVNRLKSKLGDNTDNWKGKTIELTKEKLFGNRLAITVKK